MGLSGGMRHRGCWCKIVTQRKTAEIWHNLPTPWSSLYLCLLFLYQIEIWKYVTLNTTNITGICIGKFSNWSNNSYFRNVYIKCSGYCPPLNIKYIILLRLPERFEYVGSYICRVMVNNTVKIESAL